MELDHFLTPRTKNSKWIIDLTVRCETIKLLEENIGKMLYNVNLNNNFLNMSLKVRETKVKANKSDYIKLKNFYTPLDTIINKMKRQPTE